MDGSSITGICFVGYMKHWMRAAMLLAPLCTALLLGGYFLCRGEYMSYLQPIYSFYLVY